jgi:hypothetical protein
MHDLTADRNSLVMDQAASSGHFSADRTQRRRVVVARREARDCGLPCIDQVHRVTRMGVVDRPQQRRVRLYGSVYANGDVLR